VEKVEMKTNGRYLPFVFFKGGATALETASASRLLVAFASVPVGEGFCFLRIQPLNGLIRFSFWQSGKFEGVSS
jgi:hypothetical protein